jgi:all-trans-8'-apo-beta-carotenal 15,15'-oxygenase
VGSDRTFKSLTIPFDGIVDANLQFCNAYEEGNMLAVDAIQSDGTNVKSCDMPMSYPWMTTIDEFGQYTSKKSLVRYRVNLESGSVSKEVLSDLQCYFGVVNPAVSTQKHRFIYCAVGSLGSDVAPPQGIVKFDVDGGGRDDLWIPSEYEFCGEPMFTARQHKSSSDEDDGYILTVLFNGKTQESEMLVLSAKNLSAGPICRVPLGIGIPHGLHGCFSGIKETTWTAEEIGRRAKLADKMESRGNQWNEVKSDFSGLGLRLDDIEEYFGDIF